MSDTTCVFCSMVDSAAIADDPDELLHQGIHPAVFGADDVGHEADLDIVDVKLRDLAGVQHVFCHKIHDISIMR